MTKAVEEILNLAYDENAIARLQGVKFDDVDVTANLNTNEHVIRFYANGSKVKEITLSDLSGGSVDMDLIDKHVNKTVYNVVGFGVKEGNTRDNRQNNTTIIQNLLDSTDGEIVLEFPTGDYVIGDLNLGVERNIIFKGTSSPFATLIHNIKHQV